MSTGNRLTYLDGIRGVAALVVVVFHWPGRWGFDLVHAHLAVDVFFLLSGFVIANAYGARLATGELSAGRFMVLRFLRLYPMYLLALAMALAMRVLPALRNHAELLSSWPDILPLLPAVLMLPFPVAGNTDLYPFDFPAWSLLFELLANAMFAGLAGPSRLSNRALAGIVLGSGAVLASLAVLQGSVDFGARWGALEFAMGGTRATFGIFLGVLMSRRRDLWVGVTRLEWSAGLGVLLCLVPLVMVPLAGYNLPMDLAAIFLCFPLGVHLAANGRHGLVDRLFVALGAASYPLYVLHAPAMRVFFVLTGRLAPTSPVLTGLLFLLPMVVISFWLERRVDTPARRLLQAWLERTWHRRSLRPSERAV